MDRNEFLIGRCQIQIGQIEIDPEFCRDRIDESVATLSSLLGDPGKFDPHGENNQMPMLIDLETFRVLLEVSGITHHTFQESQSHPYPKLAHPSRSFKFRCIHGRQRFEAASSVHGPQTWWTVKLYCLPEGANPRVLLCHEIEQDHFQTDYNDGHVFCAVTYWESRGMLNEVQKWRSKLKPSREGRLKLLLRWTPVRKQLEALLVFPGLFDDLELGNIERHFATRMTEEIEQYLQHIYTEWDRLTMGNEQVRRATDSATVRYLQGLVPSVSLADQALVRTLFQKWQVFPRIADSQLRSDLERRVLESKCLIPSIKTLHENMKYLDIGSHIIRSHLIMRMRKGESVRQVMKKTWRQPEKCLVEYEEGKFQVLPQSPSFRLSYLQLFICAFRNFSRLCDGDYRGPRCEVGGSHQPAKKSQEAIDQFRFLASALGFPAVAGRRSLREAQVYEEPPEDCVNRRWNRPFSNSAKFSSSKLFITEFSRQFQLSVYPGTLFVQRDFLHSFFGELPQHQRQAELDELSSSMPVSSPLVASPDMRERRREGWAHVPTELVVWPIGSDANSTASFSPEVRTVSTHEAQTLGQVRLSHINSTGSFQLGSQSPPSISTTSQLPDQTSKPNSVYSEAMVPLPSMRNSNRTSSYSPASEPLGRSFSNTAPSMLATTISSGRLSDPNSIDEPLHTSTSFAGGSPSILAPTVCDRSRKSDDISVNESPYPLSSSAAPSVLPTMTTSSMASTNNSICGPPFSALPAEYSPPDPCSGSPQCPSSSTQPPSISPQYPSVSPRYRYPSDSLASILAPPISESGHHSSESLTYPPSLSNQTRTTESNSLRNSDQSMPSLVYSNHSMISLTHSIPYSDIYGSGLRETFTGWSTSQRGRREKEPYQDDQSLFY